MESNLNIENLKTVEGCLSYLAERKWQTGFKCRKCGHTNYCQGRTPFSRRCTKCKREESATAHTIFHRCRIPLNEAFAIAKLIYENPEVSTYKLAKHIDRRQMTCWNFKKKIMEYLEAKGELRIFDKNF